MIDILVYSILTVVYCMYWDSTLVFDGNYVAGGYYQNLAFEEMVNTFWFGILMILIGVFIL